MCPCCKNIEFKEVEGFICAECSFRYIASKQLGDCSPRFCEGCGCTYSDGCSIHDESIQKKL